MTETKQNPIERDTHSTPEGGISRKEFLKKTALALTAVALGVGLGGRDKIKAPSPGELPPDLLTEEELKRAHIKIYPTPHVQLHLRRGVLELPLFKDASQGKLDEVVIALVNHDTVSWEATESLPPDAKLLWRNFNKDPIEEWREREFKNLKARQLQLEEELRGYKQVDEESELRFKETLKRYFPEEMGRRQLEDFYEARRKYGAKREELEKLLNMIKNLKEIEPPEEIKEEARDSFAIGLIIDGRLDFKKDPKFFQRHPEFTNKVFIYLAVGGKLKPKPQQSYPDPEWLKSHAELWEGRVVGVGDSSLGYALRHEIGHFESSGRGDKRGYKTEPEADAFAMNSLVEAWRKFQSSGDTSGYSFVFVTAEGLTFTKKRESSPDATTG